MLNLEYIMMPNHPDVTVLNCPFVLTALFLANFLLFHFIIIVMNVFCIKLICMAFSSKRKVSVAGFALRLQQKDEKQARPCTV